MLRVIAVHYSDPDSSRGWSSAYFDKSPDGLKKARIFKAAVLRRGAISAFMGVESIPDRLIGLVNV